jgi:hypothetical protein
MLVNNSNHVQDHSKNKNIPFKKFFFFQKVFTKFNFFVDQPSGIICFNTSLSGGLISINNGNLTLRKKIDSNDNFRVSSCFNNEYNKYKY